MGNWALLLAINNQLSTTNYQQMTNNQ